LVDRQKLVGLNEKEITAYLDTLGTIDSYELKFHPAFLHIAPQLANRIFVHLK